MHMPQSSPLLRLPKSLAERWELLSRFIGDWYHPLSPADGYTNAELQQSHITASGWRTESLNPFRALIDGGEFEILYEG